MNRKKTVERTFLCAAETRSATLRAIRDLSSVVQDIDRPTLAAASVESLTPSVTIQPETYRRHMRS